MLVGLVTGAVAVTAIGGVAGYKAIKGPDYAEVLSAKKVTEKIRTPREVCREVAETHQAPVKDQNRIAGTAIGAVLGGVLGNQVGGGKGKTLATVAIGTTIQELQVAGRKAKSIAVRPSPIVAEPRPAK